MKCIPKYIVLLLGIFACGTLDAQQASGTVDRFSFGKMLLGGEDPLHFLNRGVAKKQQVDTVIQEERIVGEWDEQGKQGEWIVSDIDSDSMKHLYVYENNRLHGVCYTYSNGSLLFEDEYKKGTPVYRKYFPPSLRFFYKAVYSSKGILKYVNHGQTGDYLRYEFKGGDTNQIRTISMTDPFKAYEFNSSGKIDTIINGLRIIGEWTKDGESGEWRTCPVYKYDKTERYGTVYYGVGEKKEVDITKDYQAYFFKKGKLRKSEKYVGGRLQKLITYRNKKRQFEVQYDSAGVVFESKFYRDGQLKYSCTYFRTNALISKEEKFYEKENGWAATISKSIRYDISGKAVHVVDHND